MTTPEKERDMRIASNQIICRKCSDTIYSTHVHDYVTCQCGSVAVDGGQDYLKRSGSNWVEDSITIEAEALDYLVGQIKESRVSGRNDLGVALAALRAFRDYEIVQEGQAWVLAEE